MIKNILLIMAICLVLLAMPPIYMKGYDRGSSNLAADNYNQAVSIDNACNMKHRSLTPRFHVCSRGDCVVLTVYCAGNFAP